MNIKLIQQFQTVRQLSGGFRASRVILTANNYAIFEHLKTPKTAAVLARTIKTDPRATEILLDAVTALGFLRKTVSTYRNTPLTTAFLIKRPLGIKETCCGIRITSGKIGLVLMKS